MALTGSAIMGGDPGRCDRRRGACSGRRRIWGGDGGGLGGGLSDASRGLGSSLSSMSVGLGSLLSSASSTFASRPSSSGGGGAAVGAAVAASAAVAAVAAVAVSAESVRTAAMTKQKGMSYGRCRENGRADLDDRQRGALSGLCRVGVYGAPFQRDDQRRRRVGVGPGRDCHGADLWRWRLCFPQGRPRTEGVCPGPEREADSQRCAHPRPGDDQRTGGRNATAAGGDQGHGPGPGGQTALQRRRQLGQRHSLQRRQPETDRRQQMSQLRRRSGFCRQRADSVSVLRQPGLSDEAGRAGTTT